MTTKDKARPEADGAGMREWEKKFEEIVEEARSGAGWTQDGIRMVRRLLLLKSYVRESIEPPTSIPNLREEFADWYRHTTQEESTIEAMSDWWLSRIDKIKQEEYNRGYENGKKSLLEK